VQTCQFIEHVPSLYGSGNCSLSDRSSFIQTNNAASLVIDVQSDME
jgi:hypothetical protein